MTKLTRPLPGAFSGTKRDALASGLYSPASAFAPGTLGLGASDRIDVYNRSWLARVRNILSGDDLIGYMFTWEGDVTTAPTTLVNHLALFALDRSMPNVVLRKIPGSSVDVSRVLSSVATHGSVELLRLPLPISLDPSKVYLVGIFQEYTVGHWTGGPKLFGSYLNSTASVTTADGGVVLTAGSGVNLVSAGGDVIGAEKFSGSNAICPGIGLATSRIRVQGTMFTEAFLF